MNLLAQMLPGLSTTSAILLKLTALLTVAWLGHFALARCNPRWRVLLWRVALVGALLLPAAELLLPRLHVPVGESSPMAILIPAPSSARHEIAVSPLITGPLSTLPATAVPRPASRPALLGWLKTHALPLLALIWGLGALALLMRLFSAHLRLRRVLSCTQPAPEWAFAMAGEIAEKVNFHGRFELRRFDAVCSPFAAGWRRPLVVLPAPMLAPDASGALPAILAHELSHLRSRDQSWMVVVRVVAACLWFHPLAWRLAAAHDAACEAVCDAAAAELSGGAQAYSSTLAQAYLDLFVDGPAPLGAPMLRAAEITRRIRRLRLGISAAALARRRVAGALCLGGAALLALGALKLVQAQPASQIQAVVGPRTLRFPSDHVVGKVIWQEPGRQAPWMEGLPSAEARGEVKIPAGSIVTLLIGENEGQDLSALDALDPNTLQSLTINSKFVLDQDLAHLKRLTGLKSLSLQWCDLTGSGFEHLQGLTSLGELRLGNHKAPLSDASMAHLAKMESLRRLDLGGTGITDDGVVRLSSLKNLQSLNLGNTLITDRGLEVIRNFSGLEELWLNRTKISDRGIASLAGLSRLTLLDISQNGITDTGLAQLKDLGGLERLMITETSIDDRGVAVLAGFKNLRELDAVDTRITNSGWAGLRGLDKLASLSLSRLDDRGAGVLSDLPALGSLRIYRAALTPASVESFRKMKRRREIWVAGDSIDEKYLNALRDALPDCIVLDPTKNTPLSAAIRQIWRLRFYQVYSLPEGEVLKRIAPPFIPERLEFYRANERGRSSSSSGPVMMVFRAMPDVEVWSRIFADSINLKDVIGSVTGFYAYEYDAPADLLKLKVPGDWIVRYDSSPDERMPALQRILESQLGFSLRFEKRKVEREVLIARGRYAPHPLPNIKPRGEIQLYVDRLDSNSGYGGAQNRPLQEFLKDLGSGLRCRVIDETESSNVPVSWRENESGYEKTIADPARLNRLLKNVEAQTELKFTKEKRLVDVWFISRR